MSLNKLMVLFLLALIFTNNLFAKDDLQKKYEDLFITSIESYGTTARKLVDPKDVENLIKQGLDLNYKDPEYGYIILGRLNSSSSDVSLFPKDTVDKNMTEILKVMIAGGLKISTATCTDSVYGIHDVLVYGMYRYLNTLLDNGCDLAEPINYYGKDKPRIRPIDLAEKYGQNEIVKALVAHGIKQRTPKESAQLRLIGGADNADVVQMLKALADGAQVDGSDEWGEIAIHKLVKSSKLESPEGVAALLLLLDIGHAKLNWTLDGKPVLIEAVDNVTEPWKRGELHDQYSVKVIKILLEKGAPISAQDDEYFVGDMPLLIGDKRNVIAGDTPLHIAVKRGNFAIAELLVHNGAKVMVLNKAGKTPLDYAESGPIIKLLKENGAIERGY